MDKGSAGKVMSLIISVSRTTWIILLSSELAHLPPPLLSFDSVAQQWI